MDPHDYLLRLITPDIHEMGNIQVAALIDPVTNTWDLDMLNWLLWEEDVNVIVQIPLANSSTPDRRIWHYTKSGFYSVKSVYHLARHVQAQQAVRLGGSNSTLSRPNWEFIWKSDLPIKIKNFVWCLLKQALPVLDVFA